MRILTPAQLVRDECVHLLYTARPFSARSHLYRRESASARRQRPPDKAGGQICKRVYRVCVTLLRLHECAQKYGKNAEPLGLEIQGRLTRRI